MEKPRAAAVSAIPCKHSVNTGLAKVGNKTPTVLAFCVRQLRALALGTSFRRAAAASTLLRVAADTLSGKLKVRETVATDTPAS